jgi:hypothetical protein
MTERERDRSGGGPSPAVGARACARASLGLFWLEPCPEQARDWGSVCFGEQRLSGRCRALIFGFGGGEVEEEIGASSSSSSRSSSQLQVQVVESCRTRAASSALDPIRSALRCKVRSAGASETRAGGQTAGND